MNLKAFLKANFINLLDLSTNDPQALSNGFEKLQFEIDFNADDFLAYNNAHKNCADFEDTKILVKVPSLASVLYNNNMLNLIYSHLGNRARLDYVSFSRLSGKSADSNSGLWHHDSVGKRLKVFIFLNNCSLKSHVSTDYIPGTHRIRRQNYENPVIKGTRVQPAENDINKKVSLTGKMSEGFIFDTNGLHRGNYKKNLLFRDTLQLEFSDYLKSKVIKGDIGPRASSFPICLLEHPLITKKQAKISDFSFAYQ